MRAEEAGSGGNMTFWEHLDVLRGTIIRIVLATVVCAVGAFFFKDELFSVILAPRDDSFIIYRLLGSVGRLFSSDGSSSFSIQLVNTGLAEQFLIHMKVSVYAGVVVASPYIIYSLFRFISPALYDDERRYSSRVIVAGYVMFMLGVLLSYLLIFPLTLRFLGTYQVSSDVENMITLQSYIDTFMMLTMLMGILFELPVVCWLLGKLGILTAGFMSRFRRHAIVVILVVAAVITPTSDVFTLLIVAMPVWLLYEASILVVGKTGKKRR